MEIFTFYLTCLLMSPWSSEIYEPKTQMSDRYFVQTISHGKAWSGEQAEERRSTSRQLVWTRWTRTVNKLWLYKNMYILLSNLKAIYTGSKKHTIKYPICKHCIWMVLCNISNNFGWHIANKFANKCDQMYTFYEKKTKILRDIFCLGLSPMYMPSKTIVW